MQPISRQFTRPLVERQLEFETPAHRIPVTLRIGLPVQDVETASGLDWRCPVEFTGLDMAPLMPGVGIDALQALTHALKAARNVADALARDAGGSFSWLGGPGHGLADLTLWGAPSS